MPKIVLLGTLDTKGNEYEFVRNRLKANNVEVILVDAGIMGQPLVAPDITREEVAEAAGADVKVVAAAGDRGAAVETMAKGATVVVQRLFEAGSLDGILSVGGSGNAALATQAMRALPVGIPKLMVTTVASGDTRPYVGAVDLTMMYSVVDISGINRISERILSNAAGAIEGMARAFAESRQQTPDTTASAQESKPLIGATMFGVTTPCVTEARKELEDLGYEVLVFHATGTGGQSMEALVKGGFLKGVLDVTTTELADELVGGVLSAGPERLEAAGKQGIPQVVSLGALDMVNFGEFESIPPKFEGRNFYKHNSSVTLMRTTPAENAELGRQIARKLNQATGPVTLFVPLKGVSMIATEGGPFYDKAADQALIESLRAGLDGSKVQLVELDMDINDPRFAHAMVEQLNRAIQETETADKGQ